MWNVPYPPEQRRHIADLLLCQIHQLALHYIDGVMTGDVHTLYSMCICQHASLNDSCRTLPLF